ncbi:MAG: AmmeMemoRadiSam system radical SAM enzyme [Anaerolineae bacterium]
MISHTTQAALLQEQVDGKVRCDVCERRCLLVDGGQGWCRTRVNRGGVLYTLVYGAVSSLGVDPIEKKPFYHFHPGSSTLTAGSWSCNFACPWCQNWVIARVPPPAKAEYVSPAQLVDMAQRLQCHGVSMSYNEPTLALEWSLDVFRLAESAGLYKTFVTNGYMTPEALRLLADAGLDAMNVDMKGDAASMAKFGKGAAIERVWNICRMARERAIHIEITTLVIPGVNDREETLSGIAARIVRELGRDVPWHISSYYPAYQFTARATPPSTLERTWRLGKDAGLDFVYIGNVPGHRYDNTYCPHCNTLLIRREGFKIALDVLGDGHCPGCGRRVPGVWAETRVASAVPAWSSVPI